MGMNLLRYALWRERGETLPVTALITGVDNPSARMFATREHFHALYYGTKSKTGAIEALCAEHRVSPDQLVCSSTTSTIWAWRSAAASECSCAATQVRCSQDYVARHGLCDYITGHAPARARRARGRRAIARLARHVRHGGHVARGLGRRLRTVFRRAPGGHTEVVDRVAAHGERAMTLWAIVVYLLLPYAFANLVWRGLALSGVLAPLAGAFRFRRASARDGASSGCTRCRLVRCARRRR